MLPSALCWAPEVCCGSGCKKGAEGGDTRLFPGDTPGWWSSPRRPHPFLGGLWGGGDCWGAGGRRVTSRAGGAAGGHLGGVPADERGRQTGHTGDSGTAVPCRAERAGRIGPARPRIGAAAPALTRRRCRARRRAGDAAGGGRRRSAPVPVPGRRAPVEPGPAMGALTSRQNAGVEEVDIPANSVYRYPPKSGKRGGVPALLRAGEGGPGATLFRLWRVSLHPHPRWGRGCSCAPRRLA